MTNEELKNKIIELLDEATGSWYEDEDGMFAEGYSAEEGDNRFKKHTANVLIAAGIGDISAWKHRAEVAERQAIFLSKMLADKTRKDYPYQAWLEAAQKQAEKELEEEKKNEI